MPQALLSALWWLLLLPTLVVGLLYLRHWTKRHRPSEVASIESWVPWVSDQLRRGVPDDEVRDYLHSALPKGEVAENDATAVERMIERAKQRLRTCGFE